MLDPMTGLLTAFCGPMFAVGPGLVSLYSLPKFGVLAAGVAWASWKALRTPTAGSERPGTRRAQPVGSVHDILGPLAACLAAATLSALFSHNRPASLLGEYSQRSFGLVQFALCAAAAALAQASGLEGSRRLVKGGTYAGGALAAFGLLQAAGLDPLLSLVGELPHGRIGSSVGSPVVLGACLAGLLPLQLRQTLDGEDAVERRSGLACGLVAIVALFMTLSRGAWFAAATGCACYLFWTGRLGRLTARRGLVLGAAALAVSALGLAALKLRPTAASDSGRVALWASAARIAAASPFVGVGPDAFQVMLGRLKTESFVRAMGPTKTQVHAHNDLLHVVATMGLLGLAAYLWLLYAAWKRLAAALSDSTLRNESAAAGAGLVAAFVFAKFNPIPLAGMAVIAVLLGLLDPRGRVPRSALIASGAVGVLALATTFWLASADRQALLGMRAQNAGRLDDARAAYSMAAHRNPFELRYGLWLDGSLRQAARAESDPARRLALAQSSVEAARAAVRWNPSEIEALHALGSALATVKVFGGPDLLDEAGATLERGLAADWSYRPLIETRLKVATLRGDRTVAADSLARLARLDGLAQR